MPYTYVVFNIYLVSEAPVFVEFDVYMSNQLRLPGVCYCYRSDAKPNPSQCITFSWLLKVSSGYIIDKNPLKQVHT